MPEIISFSAALRERSSATHSRSESAGFMVDLLKGDGSREDYVSLVAQHYFIYAALEQASERMKNDPVAGEFVTDKLTRLPAIENDLGFLMGDHWRSRISPLPATRRYADRITEVGAAWAGGFVAHHYTRYLGDLSGGLFIGQVVARRFGFDTDGVRFYIFDDIADPSAFKNEYRAKLDAAPWEPAERERVIDEVLAAYEFNNELFDELSRERAAV